MVTRLFLTLLAVLTGLAAQVAPAQARVSTGGVAEMGVVETARSGTHAVAHKLVARLPLSLRVWQSQLETSPIAMRQQALVPSVRIGIDRTRE